MHHSRQSVVGWLLREGFPQLADEASRTLPDPVDSDQLEEWGMRHGISRDDLISMFGGSP